MPSQIGTLQEVNGTTVMIDGLWYDANKIAKYLPSKTGITVEYSADENNVLAFLREKKAFTPKNLGGASSTKYNKPATKNNFQKTADSIIKQVIFKEAVHAALRDGAVYTSTEDAIEEIWRAYEQMKLKFADELK